MPGTPQDRPAPDKVTAAALGQTARGGGPDCLDAEELAAYYERSLGASEMARREAHVASCRACQERLVALVRSEPAPAAQPAWWRGWVESPLRWTWTAPALAAGLVAAVWLATRPASGPAPDLSVASDLKVAEEAARLKEREQRAMSSAPGSVEKPTGPQVLGAPPPVPGARIELPLNEVAKEATAKRAPAGVVAGKVGPDERLTTKTPVPAERPADTFARRAVTAPATGATPVLLSAPGGRIVWRIDATGDIARSDDGGTTWRGQATAGVGLLAGSAVSDAICWVVGRGGAVLRTGDGEQWEHATAPAVVDLVHVEATSAVHALVTAADGRRFETSDGGTTWVAR